MRSEHLNGVPMIPVAVVRDIRLAVAVAGRFVGLDSNGDRTASAANDVAPD
jgi:hypothetical protein